MAAAAPDPELTRAFASLQKKMVETQSNVKMADLQINSKSITIKRAQLTLKELSNIPDTVRVYKSIGRTFLLQPKSEMHKELETKMKEEQGAIEKLQEKKTYLERSFKDSEQSLREMIRQKTRA